MSEIGRFSPLGLSEFQPLDFRQERTDGQHITDTVHMRVFASGVVMSMSVLMIGGQREMWRQGIDGEKIKIIVRCVGFVVRVSNLLGDGITPFRHTQV